MGQHSNLLFSGLRQRLVGRQRVASGAFIAALYLVIFPLTSITLATPATAETLILAQVSDRPKKDFKQLLPMARYMADKLKDQGFSGARVKLFKTADELIAAVKQGQVHWISETPYTSARLIHETQSRPLVKKWKNRQRRYQTLIFTQQQSDVVSLQQLVGRRIAFEHPDSFSSYYLPKRILEQAGLSLVELARVDDPVPEGKVGYLFSRNEQNNALWVDKGIVTAGALNNGDWINSSRVHPDIRERFRIIHRSEFYPRAFELVTPALSSQAADGLQKALLALDPATDAGLLARYEQTEWFSPVKAQDLEFLDELIEKGNKPE